MQIKTTWTFGEDRGVWIKGDVRPALSVLPSYEGNEIGLSWSFKDWSVWLEYNTVPGSIGKEYLTNVPDTDERIWTIFKLKRSLVVVCNDVKVWEILYKNLYDSTPELLQQSIKGWSKFVTKLKFANNNAEELSYKSSSEFKSL